MILDEPKYKILERLKYKNRIYRFILYFELFIIYMFLLFYVISKLNNLYFYIIQL